MKRNQLGQTNISIEYINEKLLVGNFSHYVHYDNHGYLSQCQFVQINEFLKEKLSAGDFYVQGFIISLRKNNLIFLIYS